jgi:hypothetical protein
LQLLDALHENPGLPGSHAVRLDLAQNAGVEFLAQLLLRPVLCRPVLGCKSFGHQFLPDSSMTTSGLQVQMPKVITARVGA